MKVAARLEKGAGRGWVSIDAASVLIYLSLAA
jgi:hypothetical protein